MRTSRARFKYALRFTRSIEDTARADSLAKDPADGTIDDFRGNVRKMNSSKYLDFRSYQETRIWQISWSWRCLCCIYEICSS